MNGKLSVAAQGDGCRLHVEGQVDGGRLVTSNAGESLASCC